MTRDKMSRIIASRLHAYSWNSYRMNISLPDFIADAIAAEQPERPNTLAEIERLEEIVKAQLATIERTTADLNKCGAKLEEARAATPHFYHPSTMHMGDCSICGGTADTPQHDIAQWEVRCKFAEATIAAIKEAIQ